VGFAEIEKLSSELDTQEAFKSVYLQAMTREFESDLDKIRQANDYDQSRTLPILVGALSQGTSLFTNEEKKSIIENQK
jgi:ribosome assembly protein 3